MTDRRITLVGPGVAGRRESLSALLQHYAPGEPCRVADNLDRTIVVRGERFVVAVASKRSLFMDSTNAAVEEELSRLAPSSGFVFVVDSQPERTQAGVEQLCLLRDDLARREIDLDKVPVVFQLNKRDLKDVAPVAELQNSFKTHNCRYVETIATRGYGVVEAFETVLDMVDGR